MELHAEVRVAHRFDDDGTDDARGMRRERTAGERLDRAVVDERDNRAGRARVRSAPNGAGGIKGVRRL